MSWHNSNSPWRPPEPRRSSSRPNSENAPSSSRSPQTPANMARANAAVAPLPRMIAAARDRQLASNRDRINSLLGDSPYTTRRWTSSPAHHAERMRPSRLSVSNTFAHADVPPVPVPVPVPVPIPPPPHRTAVTLTPPLVEFPSQSPYPNRMTSLEQLDRTLDEANAHLRALLDMTQANTMSRQLLLPPHPSNHTPPSRPHDFSYENHRNKRRKVDSEKKANNFHTFRYGHYGQVEVGDLEMEMVSCDGGMYSTNELSFAAENILKNDNSVYCTKGNRCNIILRHRGSTAFTLSELIIKAPGSMNYSHPVRQGMVFVSMEQDDILSRTAQYQIQYAPGPRDRVTFTTDTRRRLNREPQETISISHNPDGSSTTRTTHSFVYSSSDNHVRMPMMPREFASNQPDFNVATEYSEEEEDNSATRTTPAFSILRRTPYRIGALPFENEDDDDDDDDDDADDGDDDGFGDSPTDYNFGDDELLRDGPRPVAFSNTTTTNLLDVNFDLTPGLSGSGTGAGAGAGGSSSGNGSFYSSSLAEAWNSEANKQEVARPVSGRLLAPHARFHIEKKKSKCTIRFEPPVSGRFILLKMWSSHHDLGSNIDIQSVMARGFAGPRYFPSVEMR